MSIFHSSVSYFREKPLQKFRAELADCDVSKSVQLLLHQPMCDEALKLASTSLGNCSRLTISIWFDGKRVEKSECDYTFLKAFPKLHGLRFKYATWIESLDFLRYLQELRWLHLEEIGNKHLSLGPLTSLQKLEKLFLDKTKIDLEVLSNLNSLNVLWLQSITVNSLSMLEKHPSLKKLKIALGGTTDLSALANTSLKYLELWGISKFESDHMNAICCIKTLQELMLDQINRVSFLPDMVSLKNLNNVNIERMRGLSEISGLARARALKTLRVTECPKLFPESFEPFKWHPSLVYGIIDIGTNRKNREVEGVLPLESPPGYPEVGWSRIENEL
jgi:hypothetical protein